MVLRADDAIHRTERGAVNEPQRLAFCSSLRWFGRLDLVLSQERARPH